MSAPDVTVIRVLDPKAPHWTAFGRRRLAQHAQGCEILDSPIETWYGSAVNRAAVQAGGTHLVVMRGDTLAGADWLGPLLATAAQKGAAIVTPCVTGLDGSILDAGYLATRHGDLVAQGRGCRAADSAWSFVREVSSPSPACFLVKRSAFLDAGGVNPRGHADALKDVADLALGLRSRGHRTFYQPASTVQSAATLAQLSPWTGNDSTRSVIELRDSLAAERMLVIDDRVSHVDRGGGDPRMYRILMELVACWPDLRVTLFALSPDNGAYYASALQQAGVEVVYGTELEPWLASRAYFYDVVMISRPRPVLECVRTSQPQARVIYDMEAVHVRRHQRKLPIAELDEVATLADQIRSELPIEAGLLSQADAVWCVSDADGAFAEAISPATPRVLVSHASDAPASVPGFDERKDVVFFGAFWHPGSPNEDAVLHLAQRVMPLMWRTDAAIRLIIIGADPTPAVRRLDGGNIVVRGYVPEPGEVLARARLQVVPMRVGAGIKLRLIDSMATGLPFVTTTIGAEGLPLGELYPSLVADSPADIARLALTLYNDRELWNRIQTALRALATTHFSAATFRRAMIEGMAQVGIAPPLTSVR